MLLPFTFGLPPVSALIMLAGIFYGAQYGSSIAAILVNVPGETSSSSPASTATRWRGRAAPARRSRSPPSRRSSPARVATFVIAFLSLPLAASRSSSGGRDREPHLLGLLGAVVLAHGSPLKAIAMMVVGVLIGLVGVDVNSGVPRYDLRHPRSRRRHRASADRHGPVRHRRDHPNLERSQDRDVAGTRISKPHADARRSPRRLPGHGARHRGGLLARRAAGRRRRRCRRSRPTRWRRRSPPTRRASARARSRAWRRRKPPTMPARRRASCRCSRSAFRRTR